MTQKLTLELSQVADGYHLKASSQMGEAEADLAPPFSEVEERALLRALEERKYDGKHFPPEEGQALRDLGVLEGDRLVKLLPTVGEALYGALVADGEVRQRMVSTLDAAKLARQPLPVEMRFGAGTHRLARLPWELICDQGRFLVRDTTIALSRYPEAAVPVTESLGDLPLRVLLVISRPAGVVPLDPEEERRALLHGLRTLAEEEDVVVDMLRPPTQEMLAEAVTTGGYHVVHFDGHGGFALDEAEPQGYLVFEDEYGAVQLVSADEMSATLRNTEVRLVVLSACQTAVTAAEGMWSGVAPALLQAGVPLVVAMQCSVPTDTAATFARQFYASLAHGKPLIEAVADGRRPLVGRRYHDTWFIPVLYARTAREYRLVRLRPTTLEGEALHQELRQRIVESERLEESISRMGVVIVFSIPDVNTVDEPHFFSSQQVSMIFKRPAGRKTVEEPSASFLEVDRKERIKSLRKQLRIHRRNLNHLEERAAMYSLDVPLEVLNGIDRCRERIDEIKRELIKLGAESESW